MKKKDRTPFLSFVWESIPDTEYRELLRRAFQIILSDDALLSSAGTFDEIPSLGQDEAGASKPTGPAQERMPDAR
jgi:hypothetical protein